MRILVLAGWFPFPPNNGARIRIYNLVSQLARRHDLSLVCLAAEAEIAQGLELAPLQQICETVIVCPTRPFQPGRLPALHGLLDHQPRYLRATFQPAVAAHLAALAAARPFDRVIAFDLGMVPYALSVPAVPRVLDDLGLAGYRDALRSGPLPQRIRAGLTWWKLRGYLRRVLPQFAACTAVSSLEAALLRAAVPGYSAVHVIPNAVDVASYAGRYGSPQPNTLIYSGALTYFPNRDAVRFFARAILPAIRAVVPQVSLAVTGSFDGVAVADLTQQPGVRLVGYLPDVRPAIAESWLSVVPLRFGSGTRLKILESMALGTPVVSTRKGAEGLDVTDGQNILLADTPDAFARAVVALLQSPELREQLAAGGRALVQEQYDWQVVGRRVCAVVEQAGPRAVEPVAIG